uniref:Uncharacterized protein n=1 Tax=Caenorhabditis japonica TaxID=281687 RepID=A0A8R1EPE8_CAEJA
MNRFKITQLQFKTFFPVVRSKRENFACTRRKDSRPSSEGGFPLNNNSNNSPPMRQSSSPDDDDWSFQMMYEEKVTPQKTSSSSPDDPMGNALPSVPAQLLVGLYLL